MGIHIWLPSYMEWKNFFSSKTVSGDSLTFDKNTLRSMQKNEVVLLLRNASSSTLTIDSEKFDMLYEQGDDYLYGLLFHESIRLGSSLVINDNDSTLSRDPRVTKVLWYDNGDHSSNQELSSSSWHDTLQCLGPVLSNATTVACQILIVLVRPDGVSNTPVSAIADHFPHCSITTLQETEQRPLLQLSQNPTWSALVGPRRLSKTSSPFWLLRERLVYQHREMMWKLGRIPPLVPDLVLCDYE